MLSALPKRLLMRRSRSLSPCRALYTDPGESSVRRHNVYDLEASVRRNPVIFASSKCTSGGEREEACSSNGNLHAQYQQLANRWRTSLESRRSSWAALVTVGHTGSYREERRGQNTGSGGWRAAASVGVLSTAALAFCFNRDNNNSGKQTPSSSSSSLQFS